MKKKWQTGDTDAMFVGLKEPKTYMKGIGSR